MRKSFNSGKATLMALGVAAAVTVGTAQASAAEVQLRAVAGLSPRSIVTQVFLNWVEQVNKKGKGLVQIKFLGSSEITPIFKQAAALKRGLFDMLHTPGAFYAGQVKHVDALLASNVPVDEMRKNGAIKKLDELWQKQLNAHFLGWFDTHVNFTILLGKDAKYTVPKNPGELKNMLAGMKMWSTPTFREFLVALGATPVSLPVTEILPSMDKGVVQGFGYPEYGMVGLGLQRAVKTYFYPTYYRGNTPVIVNMRKWKSLPQKVRDFLTKEAIAYETASKKFIEDGVKREAEILKKNGAKIVKLEGDVGSAYRKLAHDIAWKRLEKRAPDETPALRKLMYDPGRD